MIKEYVRGSYRKRTELEVATTILRVISLHGKVGIAPTKVIQSANLSPQMFSFYLRRLFELKLIAKRKEGKIMYRLILTARGIKYLDDISFLNTKVAKKAKELLGPIK